MASPRQGQVGHNLDLAGRPELRNARGAAGIDFRIFVLFHFLEEPSFSKLRVYGPLLSRACHGLFVWAEPGRADLKIMISRAGPGRDF